MKPILALLGLILLFGCKDNKQLAYVNPSDQVQIQQRPQAKTLIERYCYNCHGSKTVGSERIAPPMFAVKKHYLQKSGNEEEFVENILGWTQNPTQENASMSGAIEKFGVMPYQSFSKDTIRIIAAYLYNHEIQKPGHAKGKQGKGKGSCNKSCCSG